jgi:hypothetical protein
MRPYRVRREIRLPSVSADRLFFAQVREDPLLEIDALAPAPDSTIVVVSSGGCTALSLVACGAGRVISVDSNATQNHLVELKAQAVRSLEPGALLGFLGAASAPKAWRIAERAAVMRCQQQVAVVGRLCHHVVQAGRFQVSGQQQSPPCKLNRQHDAVGIVAPQDAAAGRMQHLDARRPADWIEPLWVEYFDLFPVHLAAQAAEWPDLFNFARILAGVRGENVASIADDIHARVMHAARSKA